MSYHQFKDENGDEYGSFEVFGAGRFAGMESANNYPDGWYWRACFPGCIPDGEANGPFDTEEEAIQDAQDG